MNMEDENKNSALCKADSLLKMLAGKWKPQLFRLASQGPIRFNSLLRQLPGSNKQSIALALRELEEEGVLDKITVKQKPLHIEYHLTEKGRELIPVFLQLENLNISGRKKAGD